MGMSLFAVGEVLLLLLTVGGLIARYVPPHRCWWLQVLAVGLPLLVVPLALAALLALRTPWGWIAVLNLFAVLLIGSRLIHVGSVAHVDTRSALSVVTYNAGGLADTPGSRQELRDAFARVEPDVVAWQEVPVRRLGEPAGATVVPGRFSWVVSLLSHRVPQLDLAPDGVWRSEPISTSLEAVAEGVLLSPQPERSGYSGSATRTELSWERQPFALYSIHLHPFNERPRPASRAGWLRPATWREALAAMRTTFLQQEQEVTQILQTLERERLPYLLCGDFNSTPSNWAYARLAAGLTDAYSSAGTGLGATYPSRRPLVRIDYVLASPEWEVIAAQVLSVRASDHLPVATHLRWKAAPAANNRLRNEALGSSMGDSQMKKERTEVYGSATLNVGLACFKSKPHQMNRAYSRACYLERVMDLR